MPPAVTAARGRFCLCGELALLKPVELRARNSPPRCPLPDTDAMPDQRRLTRVRRAARQSPTSSLARSRSSAVDALSAPELVAGLEEEARHVRSDGADRARCSAHRLDCRPHLRRSRTLSRAPVRIASADTRAAVPHGKTFSASHGARDNVRGVHVWLPTRELERELGQLDDVTVEVLDDWRPDRLPPSRKTVEVLVPPQAFDGDLAAIVRCLPKLRTVQALSAGVEQYCNAVPASVRVYNAAGVHVAATAEWTLAAILACERDLFRFDEQRRGGTWAPRPSRGLSGANVVIVGAGEIGMAVGELLLAFGASVTYVARRPRAGVVSVERIKELLPEADIVVLLVPLTAETRQLVDRSFLAAMRDGALLVNAARGAVVDSVALFEELHTRRLRAALDVADPEPPPPDSEIWSVPGLLLTPHVASSTPRMLERQVCLLSERLPAFARGEEVPGARDQGY
jgi:phosphoglycerate dehydrogenase-like enzyme